MTEEEKCKDPVYFYENYVEVNGGKPVLRDIDKETMRLFATLNVPVVLKGRLGNPIYLTRKRKPNH